jgi:hypothetical protein
VKKKANVDTPDLAKAQAELIALMEKSIGPELLAAVESAYHAAEDTQPPTALDVSSEGTTNA